MKRTTTALALIFAANGAFAQDLNYLSFGVELSKSDIGISNDVSINGIDATFEYSIDRVVLMFDADQMHVSSGSFDQAGHQMLLRAGYEISPSSLVYLGGGGFNMFGITPNISYYQAGYQYSAPQFEVGLQYSSLNAGPDNVDSFAVAASYDVAPGIEIGASYKSINLPGDDITESHIFGSYQTGGLTVDGSYAISNIPSSPDDVKVLSIDVSYDFGNQFRALGGVQNFDLAGPSATGVYVGGGYQVSDNVWVDASYGRLEANSGGSFESETLSLMLTFETGERSLVIDRATERRSRAFDVAGGELELTGILGANAGVPFGF